MANTEVGSAYITILPSMDSFTSQVSSGVSSAAAKAASNATSALSSMGTTASSSLTASIANFANSAGDKLLSVSKTGIKAIAKIGTSVASLAATGGMTRALNLEQAQTMFKGLKLNWEDYEQTVNDAVTGTAFSLDQAALVAANLAASGITAGEQMSTALNACVGTAATFGVELSDVGSIFQKVAAKGKVSGEEILQLQERGINATSVLADYLGITQDAVSDMVSSGEVDFETFSNAMYAAFGESAQGANQTFTGALANMQSALSRIGEKFMTPFKDQCIDVFNAVRNVLDAVSPALDPLIDKFTELTDVVGGKVVEFCNNLVAGFRDIDLSSLTDVISMIKTSLDETFGEGTASKVTAFSGVLAAIPLTGVALKTTALGLNFGMAAEKAAPFLAKLLGISTEAESTALVFPRVVSAIASMVAPVVLAVAAIAAFVAGLLYLYNTNEEVRTTIDNLVATVSSTLVPAFQEVGAALSSAFETLLPTLTNVVTTLGGALVPVIATVIEVVSGLIEAVLPSVVSIIEVIASTIETLAPIIAEILTVVASAISELLPYLTPIIEMVGQIAETLISILMPVITQIAEFIIAMMPTIQTIITTAITVIQTIIETVMPIIQTVIETVLTIISGIITAILAVIQGDWSGAWEAIQTVLSTVWSVISSVVTTVLSAIWSVISTVLSTISSIWNSIWSAIGSVISTIWSTIQSVVSSAINTVSSIISSVISTIKSIWSSGWNTVKSTVTSAVTTVTSKVKEIPTKIKSFFSNAISLLSDAGRNIIQGLINGITGMVSSLYSSITSALSGLVDKAKSALGIGSPSKVFAEIGEYTMQGFTNGIKDASEDAIDTVSNTVSELSALMDISATPDFNANGSYNMLYVRSSQDEATIARLSNIEELLQELANMGFVINLDGKQIAEGIASDSDRINGQRQSWATRGLAI